MIRPLNTKVFARRIEPENHTSGGLWIPDKALERTQLAETIRVGPEIKDLKKGDIVAIGQYTGYDFEIKNEKFVMLLEKDILGVVE